MLNGAPVGSKGVAHPSGWMTSDLFAEYLKHFVSHVNCSTASPVLLLLDNHESHISLDLTHLSKLNWSRWQTTRNKKLTKEQNRH